MKFLGIVSAILLLSVGAGGAFILLGAESQPSTPQTNDSSSSLIQAAESKAETVNVTYGENGFQPQQITIAKGSTINFTNKTQLPMWVASAPHPEHIDYPELDAGVLEGGHIAPGNPSFSFKFDRPGTWSYHNHSFPAHKAVIIVK